MEYLKTSLIFSGNFSDKEARYGQAFFIIFEEMTAVYLQRRETELLLRCFHGSFPIMRLVAGNTFGQRLLFEVAPVLGDLRMAP